VDRAFERDGFRHFPNALANADLVRLEALWGGSHGPGIRLEADSLASVADLLGDGGTVGSIARQLIGRPAFPVRAILFDKSEVANWALGWHQDRTICVAERREIEGFGPWTVKQGQLHVQPPQPILERMITLRLHLDDVPSDNGPLLVIPGSHLRGRLTEAEIDRLVGKSEPMINLARRGDIWAYRTPIVHSSAAAAEHHGTRRVLQLDYSADELPGGLRWAFSV
jgi:hypothetical protein